MIDTSFIYFAINELDCVGGIQVTASHNPIQYNGFKISGPHAKPIGSATGLDDIKRIAGTLRRGGTGLNGTYEEVDLWPQYKKLVLSFLQLKRPLKVAIDASNGMAGKMVPAVFGDVPNLEMKAKMLEVPCNLGACFDGDADRCMFLDENRKYIGSDMITALLAKDFLSRPENKGATVVYDLRSSHVVPDVITAAGGVPKRDRVGHAFIKKTMADTKAVFGGELSGHIYFRDFYYADSAAIAFARMLSVLSAQEAPLSHLMEPFYKYSQSGEINFHVEDKDAKIREIAEHYKKGKIDYLDGITVDLGNWWFNVRKSNTEPLLRLNLETPDKAMLDEKFAELKKFLGEPAVGH
jgi:phosphomannomutase